MNKVRSHLTTLGKFALLLFMDQEDDVPGQTFLSKALALWKMSPFAVTNSQWLTGLL